MAEHLNPDYRLSGEPLPKVKTEPGPEGTWRNPRLVTPEELREIYAKRFPNGVPALFGGKDI
jgi:hypothetical protein